MTLLLLAVCACQTPEPLLQDAATPPLDAAVTSGTDTGLTAEDAEFLDAGATDAAVPDAAAEAPDAAPYPLPAWDLAKEQVSAKVEWSAPAIASLNVGDSNSQVATFGSSAFVVWVGPDRRVRLAQIPLDGDATTEAFLDPQADYQVRDDGHHMFSLGIDRRGYLHVVGDMHHHPHANTDHLPERYRQAPVLYWVSRRPADVTAFDFVGDGSRAPRNSGYSYTYFSYDRDLTLYLAGRVWADAASAWNPGKTGFGLERYDEATRAWQALGAAAPVAKPAFPVILWEDNGSNGTAYQAFKTDLRFDARGRLHVTAAVNNDDSWDGSQISLSMTDIAYAWSDDQGRSFHRADGTPATLPLRIDPGPGQASVLFTGHWFGMMPSVDVLASGEPAVSFEDLRSQPGRRRMTWLRSDGSWAPPVDLDAGAKTRQYVDRRGVHTSVRGGRVVRFLHPTGPTRSYTLEASHLFDRRLLVSDGELRCAHLLDVGGTTHLAVSRLVVSKGP